MQNSIWKLVSLAGVVGICFLLVLMAQNGLQQEEQQLADQGGQDGAVAEVPDSDASPDQSLARSEEPESDAAGSSWPETPESSQQEPSAPAQQEPPLQNEPDPFLTDASQPANEPQPFADLQSEPTVSEAPDAESGGPVAETTQPGPEPRPDNAAVVDAERPVFQDLPKLPELAAPADPVSPSDSSPVSEKASSEKASTSFDPLVAGKEPVAAPAAEPFPAFADRTGERADTSDATAEDPGRARKMARKLMDEAREAIDDNRLGVARKKAVAASELPVTWNALEQGPDSLIARIDSMMTAEELRSIAGTRSSEGAGKSQSEEGNPESDILPVSGEESATRPDSEFRPEKLPEASAGSPAVPAPARQSPSEEPPSIDLPPMTDGPVLEEPAENEAPVLDPFAADPSPSLKDPFGSIPPTRASDAKSSSSEKPAPALRGDAAESPSAESPVPRPSSAGDTVEQDSEPALDEPSSLPGLMPEPALAESAPLPAGSESGSAPKPEPDSEPEGSGVPGRLASADDEPALSPPVPETASDTAVPAETISVAQRPELTIRKIAPEEATVGEPMIYSIEISNQGRTNAAKVVVEDQVPEGCRLIGTIPQAELIEKKLRWRIGRLAAGGEKKILIKVIPNREGEIGSIATVNFVAEVSARTDVRQPSIPTDSREPAAPINDSQLNDSQLNDSQPSAGTNSRESPARTDDRQAAVPAASATPAIRLDVSNPDQARVGEKVLFRFRVTNDGEADAENVSLQDIIPAGFEHPAGHDVTYEIGQLPAGKSVDVELELKAVKPGQHVNRAVIRTGEKTAVEKSAAVEVVDDNGLTLKMPPSQSHTVGQTSRQRIQITNESSSPVSGAAVRVELDSDLEFVSASGNSKFDKKDNSIRWQLPGMKPGETVTVTATVVPRTYGVHSSTVELIQPDRPRKQADALVEASGIGALHLTLNNAPATALPGDEFALDITVMNRGTGPDSNAQLTLTLPEELEFVNARGPVRNLSPEPAENGQSVRFKSIPEIGEGASVDFQITLEARAAGRPKIRAEVRSDQLTDPVATEAAVVVLDTTP